jgi:hypothetical protein
VDVVSILRWRWLWGDIVSPRSWSRFFGCARASLNHILLAQVGGVAQLAFLMEVVNLQPSAILLGALIVAFQQSLGRTGKGVAQSCILFLEIAEVALAGHGQHLQQACWCLDPSCGSAPLSLRGKVRATRRTTGMSESAITLRPDRP